jgi:ubiquinone/menaquinone biosynthesis C-methylase UbiE
MQSKPRLYDELASWWPVLSAPEDYAEEAETIRKIFTESTLNNIETMLELGSGGGNNASHLKAHFKMTLVDISPGMLKVSQKLNPGCEHVLGDMRTIRLGKLFDTVLIHDAISYMTNLVDLKAAIETAFIHCKPGGAALFAPDYTKENFKPLTKHGGHENNGRGLRYVEWVYDPNPNDENTITDFAYLLRNQNNHVWVEYDRHVTGLFYQADWLRIIREVGFEPKVIPFEHSEIEPGTCELFVGKKP